MAMKIEELVKVEYQTQRVLTTKQIADAYSVTPNQIKNNFRNSRQYFQEGVHFFKVEGEALNSLKMEVKRFDPLFGRGAKCLTLWTKEGAVRHCKMLNTQRAWDMFDMLEHAYFAREEVVGENISLAEFNALKEQVLGLTATFNEWLADIQKQLTPCQRVDKLLALAEKIKDDEARDKVLLRAANLLIGKNIF